MWNSDGTIPRGGPRERWSDRQGRIVTPDRPEKLVKIEKCCSIDIIKFIFDNFSIVLLWNQREATHNDFSLYKSNFSVRNFNYFTITHLSVVD